MDSKAKFWEDYQEYVDFCLTHDITPVDAIEGDWRYDFAILKDHYGDVTDFLNAKSV